MATALQRIEIPRRSHSCFKDGKKFTSGMEIVSVLLEDHEQQLMRQDYCLECWNSVQKEESLAKHTFWKSAWEIRDKKAVSKSSYDHALALLRAKIENSQDEEEIFVLALYLAHARKLILRKEMKKEDSVYSIYEIAHEEDYLPIKKLNFSQIDTKAIQASLSQQLNLSTDAERH